uniref:keratin, type 1 cytoskeletal 11-like n=1 Tax=Myxine glutinosa TaxID=7769 RepID=UPI00358F8FDB
MTFFRSYSSQSLRGTRPTFRIAHSGGSMSAGAFGTMNNEKGAMQDLNDRLSNYMDKVRRLERTNEELEMKIKEMCKTHGSDTANYNVYFSTIAELKSKVLAQVMENASLTLEIDNARLAADDFHNKWQTEVTLHSSVEGDIGSLGALLDEYTLKRAGLETDVEFLQEELAYMKKNHEDEIAALRAQISGAGMSVEVDSAPGIDLARILKDMRNQYEALVAQHNAEAEAAFQNQAEKVKIVVEQKSQAVDTAKTDVLECRRSMQTLQIELDTMRGQVNSLEYNLTETEARKAQELASYDSVIQRHEQQLYSMKNDVNKKMGEYSELLNQKMLLEAEIATYRRLLDGNGSSHSSSISKYPFTDGPETFSKITDQDLLSSEKSTMLTSQQNERAPVDNTTTSQRKKTVIITEVIKDGRVVSSSQDIAEAYMPN